MKLTIEPVPIAEPVEKHWKQWLVLLLVIIIGTVSFCSWQSGAAVKFWHTQVVPDGQIDHRVHDDRRTVKAASLRFNINDYALPYSQAQFRAGLKNTRRYNRYLAGLLMIKNGPVLSIYAPSANADYTDISTMLGLGAVELTRSAPGTGHYILSSRTMDNDRLLFSPLKDVSVGQQITLAAEGDREWQYRVVEKRLISQADTSWQESIGATPTLTLLTANDSQSNRMHRLVITAQVIGSK